jgi:hypothetical protein
MKPLHLPESLQQLLVDALGWLAILRLVVGAAMLAALGNITATNSKSTQILLIMFALGRSCSGWSTERSDKRFSSRRESGETALP